MIQSRKKYSLLLLFYLLAVCALTLTPREKDFPQGFFWFLSFTGGAERFLNFILLFPLPLLVVCVWPRFSTIGLGSLGPSLSLIIESAQMGIVGRVSDWRDLALNSAGALMATLLATQLRMRNDT